MSNSFILVCLVDVPCDLALALRGMFPILNSLDFDYIHAPFTPNEIKRALFDMSPFKSPGLDGLHASFFQRLWQMVGKSYLILLIIF